MSQEKMQTSIVETDSNSDDKNERIRRDSIDFIRSATMALKVPVKTTNTAIMIFHRFCAKTKELTKQTNIHDICRACIFSACKIEETPRRIRDVMNTTYRLQFPGEPMPIPMTQKWHKWKSDLITLESKILDIIHFQFNNVYPHQFVLHCCNELKASQKVVWLSWAVCNDVMYDSEIVLTYKAHEIAVATIRVASELIQQTIPSELTHLSSDRKNKNIYKDSNQNTISNLTTNTTPIYSHEYGATGSTVGNTIISNRSFTDNSKKLHKVICGTVQPHWWKKFDISENTLNEICSKILNLYESPISIFERLPNEMDKPMAYTKKD